MTSISKSALAAILLTTGVVSASGQERVHVGERLSIDRTEVTIAAFRRFADAKGLRTAAEREGGGFEYATGWERRRGWSVYRPFGEMANTDAEPAVHVSWQEASEYCVSAGGRLPTRAEWSLAAYTEMRSRPPKGFVKNRTYHFPVGERWDGINSSHDDPWPRHAAAGSTRAGVNGLHEMGGNVWEWLADRNGENALTAGGSWWYGPDKALASAMQWKPASFYAAYVGFRCVYLRHRS